MRVRDLDWNAQRVAMAQKSQDIDSYFEELGVTLRYHEDPLDQLTRIADLCRKTNQFNLSLGRMTEAQIAAHMRDPAASVISISLKDRLSDSGVIGAVIARRLESTVCVEELAISCRALGRKLESIIIAGAIKSMPVFDGCDQVSFLVRLGPRNAPALAWLAEWNGSQSPIPEGRHVVSPSKFVEFRPSKGVTIEG